MLCNSTNGNYNYNQWLTSEQYNVDQIACVSRAPGLVTCAMKYCQTKEKPWILAGSAERLNAGHLGPCLTQNTRRALKALKQYFNSQCQTVRLLISIRLVHKTPTISPCYNCGVRCFINKSLPCISTANTVNKQNKKRDNIFNSVTILDAYNAVHKTEHYNSQKAIVIWVSSVFKRIPSLVQGFCKGKRKPM